MKRALTRPLVSALLAFGTPAAAQSPATSTVPIHFAPGTSAKTVTGTIKGYVTIDYTLSAKAGQIIVVKLTSPRSAVFSVIDPSGNALDGSTETNDFTGQLPATGGYRVRVGLMRNDARRPVTARYTLAVSVR